MFTRAPHKSHTVQSKSMWWVQGTGKGGGVGWE
ncbi:unnamed protein product [Ectocarpus sp. CCAP 1310/34]|nr:unnamed protein product [Ectocarpus sp. CCAP 1310/34]